MSMVHPRGTKRKMDQTVSIPDDLASSWQGLLEMLSERLRTPLALLVPSDEGSEPCVLLSTTSEEVYRGRPGNGTGPVHEPPWWDDSERSCRVPISRPDGSLFAFLCAPAHGDALSSHDFYLQGQRLKRLMQCDLAMLESLESARRAQAEAEATAAQLREDCRRERDLNESLSRNQHQFYQLFDLASDPIFIGVLGEGLAHVNQAACDHLGYTREELLNKSIYEIDGLHTREEVDQRLEETLSLGSIVFESVHLHRDGTRLPVEINSRVTTLDGRTAIVCVVRDISHRAIRASGQHLGWNRLEGLLEKRAKDVEALTQRLAEETDARHRAEEAQTEGNTLFHAVSRESSLGIVLIAADGTVREPNPAFCRMLGYEAHELTNRSLVSLVYEDDADQHALLIRELVEGRRDEFRLEKRYMRKDGGIVWGCFTGALIRNPAGAPMFAVGMLEDIGARKRSEEELRFAEAKSRSILEAIPDLMFQISDDGHIVDYHASSVDALAMPPERFLGRRYDEILPPELSEPFRGAIEEARRHNRVVSIEYQMAPADKRVRDYEARLAPISTGGFLTIVRDVTERKESETALRRSEERFRVAQELSLDGFLIIRSVRDDSGTIVDFECEYGNPAAERIGAWRGCRGMRFHEAFVAVPNRRELFEQFVRIVESGIPEDHESYIAGSEVAGWFRYMAVKLGDGLAVSFSDVTARVKTEQERARLAAAVEQAAEAIVITDRNGVIQYVNPAFTAVTGYTRDEVVGETPCLLRSGRHDEAFYRVMWETITSGEVWSGEIVNMRKNGTLYTEDMTITPVRDATGTITNFVAIKQDITQRKQLEAEFRQAQKLEAVGRLAGGVAHDFNNLLTAILGSTDLLLDQVSIDDPLREEIDEIRSAGERAAVLTRQLLAFSRRQVLDPTILNLNLVVTNLEKMLRRLIGEDVNLECVLDGDLWTTRADAGQLEQVLLNLVVNARDAMPGGGHIVVTTRNAILAEHEAQVHDAVPGRYVALAVSDTGIGIAPEHLRNVFEPFFTTKPEGKGTGLGLSTVYGIARQSGGFVEVESQPDCGSTFTVYLPAVTACDVTHTPTVAHPQYRGRGETILVVEDDATVLKLVSRILEKGGYKVLAATRSEMALDLLERHRASVKLILTDVIMPGMSGPAMVSKATTEYPELPVLFMSAYVDRSPEELQKAFPTAPFIAKPFTPEKLLHEVGALLAETCE